MENREQQTKSIEQLTPTSTEIKTSELIRDFNEIILTEEETIEALRAAREVKYYQLERIKYLQALNTPRVIRKFTAEEILAILEKDFKKAGWVIDDANREVIWLLCLYFTMDERFELEGYSLQKGIVLFGGVGVGKTTLLKIFISNQHQSYIMKMCRAIEDEFSKDGDIVLKEYGLSRQAMRNSDKFGHQVLGYCFDDLGTEPQGKYYGKEANTMAEVILNRYDNELPFNQTHITTNLSIEQIKDRYGDRVTDRMRQMFNLIGFPKGSSSRRK